MTSEEQHALREGASALGVAIDSGSIHRIGRYIDLLELWNRRLRLTGDRDRLVLIRKHTLDSLAVLRELPASGMVVDLGSGAGFPGMVLACARPGLELWLVEPRRRPTSFLSEVIRTIPLPSAQVLEARAEDAVLSSSLAGMARVVVSRALRLELMLQLGAPLLHPHGLLVAMQTPRMSLGTAGEMGRGSSLELVRHRDYDLPGGVRRRLLIFRRPRHGETE